MHRVDVVMPAHNAARFIAAAVEGVLAQTFEDWRLLVVDDASTDETCATVRQAAAGDARVETLKLGANGGAAAARNTGFEATQAPFVAFLDSDDIWCPNALALLTQSLIDAPDAPAAHGLAERMDEDGQPVLVRGRPEVIGTRRPVIAGGRRRYLQDHEPTGLSSFVVSSEVPTPGVVLLRRTALEAAGPRPWDQQAFPADDWDLWLRLTGEHGFAFVPQVVLRYRRHTAQATGQASARLRAADGYVRAKFLASCTSETDRALMTAGARFHEARLSALRRRWAIEEARRGHPIAAAKQVRHAATAFLASRRWRAPQEVR